METLTERRMRLDSVLDEAYEVGRKEGYEEAVGAGELNVMSGANNAFARGQAYGEKGKAAAVQAEHEKTVEDVEKMWPSDAVSENVRHRLGMKYLARTNPPPKMMTVRMPRKTYRQLMHMTGGAFLREMHLVDPTGEKE